VDYLRTPNLGPAPADQTIIHDRFPLLRRRVQVVAEGLDGGAVDISVLPFRAGAFTAYSAGVADGAATWVHCGGSVGGVFIEGLRVAFVGLGLAANPTLILSSTPEGL
jgi:hypothetical protein